MKLLWTGRRMGKTFNCVQELKKDPKVILAVHEAGWKRQLINEFKLSPEQALRVVTYRELLDDPDRFRGRDFYRDPMKLIIDELEYFVLYILRTRLPILGVDLHAATITTKRWKVEPNPRLTDDQLQALLELASQHGEFDANSRD